MRIFDTILNGYHGEAYAIEYLRGMVWNEVQTTEQRMPTNSRVIDSHEGVTLYYDYGADYYFYEDSI
jgi:hypothetical protein